MRLNKVFPCDIFRKSIPFDSLLGTLHLYVPGGGDDVHLSAVSLMVNVGSLKSFFEGALSIVSFIVVFGCSGV